MNDENRIDLSIEMYEDLKETLVKAIKMQVWIMSNWNGSSG